MELFAADGHDAGGCERVTGKSGMRPVYEGPDRIYLFGFSRGAFTVRSLAGMLHKVGLLERNADNHLEYAAKIYNQRGNARVAAGFKATFIGQ